MNQFFRLLKWSLAGLGIVVLSATYGYGYIDPGTGSYLIQLLIAGFVAASFAVKIFWKKIAGFFGRLFGRRSRKEDEPLDE